MEKLHSYCRTERYYSGTVIPSLLLHDNLRLLPSFLDLIARKAAIPDPPWKELTYTYDTVEIITEFDYIRDVFQKMVSESEPPRIEGVDISRPDILIILGPKPRCLLSIECKFIARVNIAGLHKQISSQRKVLNLLVNDKKFDIDRYFGAGVLTQDDQLEVSYQEAYSNDEPGQVDFFLTYGDLVGLLDNFEGSFYQHQRAILENAVQMYEKEFPPVPLGFPE